MDFSDYEYDRCAQILNNQIYLYLYNIAAGKIIWISRKVSHIIGPKIIPHYQFAVAIL